MDDTIEGDIMVLMAAMIEAAGGEIRIPRTLLDSISAKGITAFMDDDTYILRLDK